MPPTRSIGPGKNLSPSPASSPSRWPFATRKQVRPSRTWKLAGVLDQIVKLPDGRTALKENKTTSRDFSPGADYWTALHMDPQLSIYVLAAREMGYDIDTILYDVTRRPALRPLMATPDDKRKYKKDGSLYANQRESDEAPEEYSARVFAKIAEKPGDYFARIEIARLESELDACRAELWMQQKIIRQAQNMGYWYRNPGSCHSPYACEYLSICQNTDLDTVTPIGFRRVEDKHPEVTGAALLGG